MCDEYGDGQKALRHRFDWERYFAGLDVEIVVLGGDSLEAIKRTHSRYFQREADPTADVQVAWP